MLLTATVAALATGMISQMNRWYARSEVTRASVQSRSLAQAAVKWSAQYLAEKSRLSGNVDHLGELWATGLPPTPVEGGLLSGRVVDAQSRFNLNNVRSEKGELRAEQAAIAAQIFRAAGATDGDFNRALTVLATRPLSSFAEVEVADANARARLAQLLTVLPAATAINVNTASDALLRLLAPETDPRAWAARSVTPFTNLQDATEKVKFVRGADVAIGTRYFFVDLTADFSGARTQAHALIDRTQGVVWSVLL